MPTGPRPTAWGGRSWRCGLSLHSSRVSTAAAAAALPLLLPCRCSASLRSRRCCWHAAAAGAAAVPGRPLSLLPVATARRLLGSPWQWPAACRPCPAAAPLTLGPLNPITPPPPPNVHPARAGGAGLGAHLVCHHQAGQPAAGAVQQGPGGPARLLLPGPGGLLMRANFRIVLPLFSPSSTTWCRWAGAWVRSPFSAAPQLPVTLFSCPAPWPVPAPRALHCLVPAARAATRRRCALAAAPGVVSH